MAGEFIVVTGNTIPSDADLALQAVQAMYGFPDQSFRVERSEDYSQSDLSDGRLTLFAESQHHTIMTAPWHRLPYVGRYATELLVVNDRAARGGIGDFLRRRQVGREIERVLQQDNRLTTEPRTILIDSVLSEEMNSIQA